MLRTAVVFGGISSCLGAFIVGPLSAAGENEESVVQCQLNTDRRHPSACRCKTGTDSGMSHHCNGAIFGVDEYGDPTCVASNTDFNDADGVKAIIECADYVPWTGVFATEADSFGMFNVEATVVAPALPILSHAVVSCPVGTELTSCSCVSENLPDDAFFRADSSNIPACMKEDPTISGQTCNFRVWEGVTTTAQARCKGCHPGEYRDAVTGNCVAAPSTYICDGTTELSGCSCAWGSRDDGAGCQLFHMEEVFNGNQRCGGGPIGAWNNLGEQDTAEDCAAACFADSACDFVVWRQQNKRCTKMATCEAKDVADAWVSYQKTQVPQTTYEPESAQVVKSPASSFEIKNCGNSHVSGQILAPQTAGSMTVTHNAVKTGRYLLSFTFWFKDNEFTNPERSLNIKVDESGFAKRLRFRNEVATTGYCYQDNNPPSSEDIIIDLVQGDNTITVAWAPDVQPNIELKNA